MVKTIGSSVIPPRFVITQMRLIQNKNSKLTDHNILGLEYKRDTSGLSIYNENTTTDKNPLATPMIWSNTRSCGVYPLPRFFKPASSVIFISSEYRFTIAKLKKIKVEKAISQNDIGISVTRPPATIRVE